jgi:hypothetical protein
VIFVLAQRNQIAMLASSPSEMSRRIGRPPASARLLPGRVPKSGSSGSWCGPTRGHLQSGRPSPGAVPVGVYPIASPAWVSGCVGCLKLALSICNRVVLGRATWVTRVARVRRRAAVVLPGRLGQCRHGDLPTRQVPRTGLQRTSSRRKTIHSSDHHRGKADLGSRI